MAATLIITCDQLPMPPLNGTSKKTHDVLASLRGRVQLHVLTYTSTHDELQSLRRHWDDVEFHALERVSFGARTRSVLSACSVPTVTRNFAGEAGVVNKLMRRHPDARLLIDFISGAPLVRHFASGVVISGHDCMSHLFAEEANRTSTLLGRAHFGLRRIHARRAERRYYHKADAVHVVSEKDAHELQKLDARIRTTVIPIAAQVPPASRLAPRNERALRMIWGNLGSPVILAGVRQLLTTASGALRGWTLLGRVPADEASRLLPGLKESGITYVSSVDDVSNLLGAAEVVVLPDVGGTGQKNRTLDALAHGACVIGLQEAFRGIDALGQFVALDRLDEVFSFLAAAHSQTLGRIGGQARDYASSFDVSCRADRWQALIDSVPPLAPAALHHRS
jgi:hypothetical protein